MAFCVAPYGREKKSKALRGLGTRGPRNGAPERERERAKVRHVAWHRVGWKTKVRHFAWHPMGGRAKVTHVAGHPMGGRTKLRHFAWHSMGGRAKVWHFAWHPRGGTAKVTHFAGHPMGGRTKLKHFAWHPMGGTAKVWHFAWHPMGGRIKVKHFADRGPRGPRPQGASHLGSTQRSPRRLSALASERPKRTRSTSKPTRRKPNRPPNDAGRRFKEERADSRFMLHLLANIAICDVGKALELRSGR